MPKMIQEHVIRRRLIEVEDAIQRFEHSGSTDGLVHFFSKDGKLVEGSNLEEMLIAALACANTLKWVLGEM